MTTTTFITQQLKAGIDTTLLYVPESSGSSPGRQGFYMAVSADGKMAGSVGGGIMEHKMVEQARKMLLTKTNDVFLKRQIHSKAAPKNQSGMICSGEQWIAIYYLNPQRAASILRFHNALQNQLPGQLLLNQDSIFFQDQPDNNSRYEFRYLDANNWSFKQNIRAQNLLYIFGGGHVGLALSKLMAELDFYTHIIDDREGLNTMAENTFAHEKHCLSYDKIAEFLPEGENVYIVLMSFGYRTDKSILKAIIDKNFRYLGMMGAQAKVDQLFRELSDEGIDQAAIDAVHAPIGLNIASKTPAEIAVSIAAQLIATKNLSTKT